MFKKMFGDKKEKEKEKEIEKDKKEKERKERKEKAKNEEGKEKKKSSSSGGSDSASGGSKKSKPKPDGGSKSSKSGKSVKKGPLKRKGKKVKQEVQVDTSKPIDYPCVPEIIQEYHSQKPFLKPNEEWLVVELAEYECLVDSLEIIQMIAKHSKFFELDPPELWEEFFEFVDDMPSYDEVVNYDVWQEFRDTRYPC